VVLVGPTRTRTLVPMTGGEIIVVSKAAQVAGKALTEDEKTKDVLLRVAEGTPEMRAAARTMAARTAAIERVKLKLWQPLFHLFGISTEYFEDTFPQEMAAKTADIPDENLITPAPSVAVPALQGLAYTFEEPNLKELYLNLLATASDDRRAQQAHPAFPDIIKQLSPRETSLLNVILRLTNFATARVKNVVSPDGSFGVLMSHLLPLASDNGELEEEPQAPTWVDNWQRLGLVDVSYREHLTGDNMYDWVQTRPEYIRLSKRPDITKIDFDKGVIKTKDFGQQFFRAVTE
jgi:hypothetical protein